MQRRTGTAIALALFWTLRPTAAHAQYYPDITGTQIQAYVIAALLGAGLGALASDRLAFLRPYLKWGFRILFWLLPFLIPYPAKPFVTIIAVLSIFGVAYALTLSYLSLGGRSRTFGSAQWATAQVVRERGLVGTAALTLGYYPTRDALLPLHYAGDRHLLTVAPTRAGKGVAAIIPNLLTYRGSAIVIDPKGENAVITALRRGPGDEAREIEGLDQEVHIVDPWGIAAPLIGTEPSCFNPLDWLDPASPEIGENAMMLADALVVPAHGSSADPFWNEEAKALLMGLILYVAIAPAEIEQRHLGRVRDILTSSPADFNQVLEEMLNSDNSIVASTAARTASKDSKLLASVLASAQAQTHFLDSPSLRVSLSRSDFRFEDMKATPMTVYLVLPADRLEPFGRWLRLLIQQAITVNARNIAVRPVRPILFMLDEMAALGRLTMVEQAFSLMAGFGMQLWGIVQDLSQLHRIYGDGWQTFIGNSGVLQYFGSRDKMTAEYFSDLCGVSTVMTITSSISKAFSSSKDGGSSSTSETRNTGETARKLIMPDELMRVGSAAEILLVENLDPIIGRKHNWYTEDRFKGLGVNLREAPTSLPVEAHLPPPLPDSRIEATQRVAAEMRNHGWRTRVIGLERWSCLGPQGEEATFASNADLVAWWDGLRPEAQAGAGQANG